MIRYKRLSVFALVFFKIALDFVFCNYIAEQYIYYGYVLGTGIFKTIIMWIALVAYIPFSIKWLFTNQLKEKTLFFLSVMYYVPGLSAYQFIKVDVMMLIAWMLFWWVLFVFACFPPIKGLNNLFISHGRIIALFIFLTTVIIVFFYSWKYTGLRIRITFTDEYSLRAEERTIVMPLIMRYLYSGAPIILSFGTAISVLRNKYLLTAFFVVTQIVYFSIGGHKSVLIMMLISIGLVFVCKFGKEIYRNAIILFSMLAEVLFEIIFASVTNSIVVTANISRRVYFIPQILNTFYYKYVSNNGYDYYAHGMGRILGIRSVYDEPLARIISKVYFGTNGNANNGMFSEAYSNLGIIGCIILPIFILLVVRILSYFVENSTYTIVTLFGFFCAYVWGSGNITTGLFTNGLLLCALCIFFMNNYGVHKNG